MDLATLLGSFAPMVEAVKKKTGMVERVVATEEDRNAELALLTDYAFSTGAENHVLVLPDFKGYEIRAFIAAKKKA
jgi:hypothetical protein